MFLRCGLWAKQNLIHSPHGSSITSSRLDPRDIVAGLIKDKHEGTPNCSRQLRADSKNFCIPRSKECRKWPHNCRVPLQQGKQGLRGCQRSYLVSWAQHLNWSERPPFFAQESFLEAFPEKHTWLGSMGQHRKLGCSSGTVAVVMERCHEGFSKSQPGDMLMENPSLSKSTQLQ